MGRKAAETACNINAFGPGTANKCIVQQYFKKFSKGDKSLEGEESSGWPLEVDNDQLRAIIKADPLTTMQEVAKELNIDHSMVAFYLENGSLPWKRLQVHFTMFILLHMCTCMHAQHGL